MQAQTVARRVAEAEATWAELDQITDQGDQRVRLLVVSS
jgi:hypothetical protein